MTADKHETASQQPAPAPKAEATPPGTPGYLPSINEPEGSEIHPATPGQQKPGGTQAHRLDNDPKVHGPDADHPGLAGKNGDDDDDDDNGGTTRTRTTTVHTKRSR